MPDQIDEQVISVVASVKRVPREAVSIASTFEELGIDSLDSINILFELEACLISMSPMLRHGRFTACSR